jgi:Zn-finger nucleic acid-binding protein
MLCASCSGELQARRTDHGVVWLCGSCVAGATTVGVLRKVAPRSFINHLWQAGLTHGRPSTRRCPSCTQPLLELDGAQVELSPSLQLCCRCYLVWLDRSSLKAFRLDEQRLHSAAREAAALFEVEALGEPERIAREARNAVVLALATGQDLAVVLEKALEKSAD